MKYVSLAKSRAGWQPEQPEQPKQPKKPKKSAESKPSPKTSVDTAASNTNPDDGLSVSKHEED